MRRMLLIGTQYPGLKSVEWSDWESGNILDYQSLLFDCRGSFTPVQIRGLQGLLRIFVGQGHQVFVILPLVSDTLELTFLPDIVVSVRPQRGKTLMVDPNPQPPFDKYIEVLDGHEIVFSLRNPNPNDRTFISHQPFVVDNVKMLVCAKVGNICLFHPAGRGKSTKALEIIISFFNPDLEECQPDPTPSWGEELIATIPGTKEIKTRISEIDGKIEGLKRRRDTDEEELQALSEWGQLLWLTGIPLQRLVQKAFKYLGFEIEPRPETGHTEDFVAKYGSAVYLIEATGSAGSITIDKGRQLMQWVISSEFEKCHGILVGNAFSKEPPEKRPPTPNHHVFTPDLKQFAEKYDFSLLDTWELFRAVCAKLAHQPTPIESLCTALSKVGAVEFPDRAENKQAT